MFQYQVLYNIYTTYKDEIGKSKMNGHGVSQFTRGQTDAGRVGAVEDPFLFSSAWRQQLNLS